MTINELIEKSNLEVLNLADGNREISTGYAGDLLSIVMSKAPNNSLWFTVMNNINVLAVATLADISAVVICAAEIFDEFVEKAKEQNVTILKSNDDVYSTIKKIGEL